MEMRSLHYSVPTEEDTYEPLDEEMVRQAIGGILPDDILDSMHVMSLANQSLTEEDMDIFSSGGGLEMDGEVISTDSRKASNHHMKYVGADLSNEDAYIEHPSRTLFVRSINSNVEDSELRALFEPFGEIRSLYTACKHRGFVMVSYFDIRAARIAMRALHNRQLRNKKLDIHFSFPKDNPSDKDINQGTLVIFNLSPSISSNYLREVFGKYGEIKEIRATPQKSHHRFIEFYDIRDAESAMKGLNKAVIGGRRIKIEPSRPGVLRSSAEHHIELPEKVTRSSYDTQSTSPLLQFSPGLWEPLAGNSMDSFSQGSVRYSPRSYTHCHSGNNHSDMKQMPAYHPSSLSEYQNGALSSFITSAQDFPHSEMRAKAFSSDSPTFQSLLYTEHTQAQEFCYGNRTGNIALSRSAKHHLSAIAKSSSSPPEMQFSYSRNSPDTPLYGPGSLGSGFPVMHNSPIYHKGSHKEEFRRLDSQTGFVSTHYPSGSLTTKSHNYDAYLVQQRVDSTATQSDPKDVYRLDLNRIKLGEDTRTTLMIKNIPNKYTAEMLLEAIDKTHHGTYDFMYLPIDFKNNCNVGYAFINMTSPSHIISIYEALDGRKWERFNSEKVACLAYARIQGKAALVSHFQNSSLMNEDGRCQPILFDHNGRRSSP